MLSLKLYKLVEAVCARRIFIDPLQLLGVRRVGFYKHTRPSLLHDQIPGVAVMRAIECAKFYTPLIFRSHPAEYFRNDAIFSVLREDVFFIFFKSSVFFFPFHLSIFHKPPYAICARFPRYPMALALRSGYASGHIGTMTYSIRRFIRQVFYVVGLVKKHLLLGDNLPYRWRATRDYCAAREQILKQLHGRGV